MEFLVILIAWALARNVELPAAWRRDEWLVAWRLRANEALAALPQAPRLLLICLLPCVLVALLEWLFALRWAGILLFALELAVLLYSIGRTDFRERLAQYLACWQRSDYEAAYQEAIRLFGLDPAATVDTPADLHALVRRHLLYQAFAHWFAVVFWFYFLGPWAALFYRILQLTLAQNSSVPERELVRQWLLWIEWLPARMLGLAFAITGNFAGCIVAWRNYLAGFTPVPELLSHYADRALDLVTARAEADGAQFGVRASRELLELDTLLARSAIAWLVMFALLQMLR